MISDPKKVIEKLRSRGVGGDHPFALASMMLKKCKGDWQQSDAECRRQARRFLDNGDEENAAVMSLAARICVFYGTGR